MTNRVRAETIVAGIIDDFTDRKGLQDEWDLIDDDIREEIKQQWIDIVLSVLGAD